MSGNQDDFIVEFCEVTGADAQSARHFLEASNWNLEGATGQFFEDNDDGLEEKTEGEAGDDEELVQAAPSSSTSNREPTAAPIKRSNISTLKDLTSSSIDEEDEDKTKQDFFTGGEKSGLAVQDPNAAGAERGGNLINDILRRAAEGGQRRQVENESASPITRPRFTGSGHTLGSEDIESVLVPDPTTLGPPPRTTVTRALTFWRNGFSVEDGPLMRYDDPANREILQAIESGRAPLSLMNVEPGQAADVNVFKRLDEDYVAPKKKFQPFSGQGQRLGSFIPGTPSTPAPVVAASGIPSSSQTTSVAVDSSSPTTNLQIRLGDGTRLMSIFNHSHTVANLYEFVNASSSASRSRGYILQTTFPNNELKDMGKTLKEAGLINTVVVQKWVP